MQNTICCIFAAGDFFAEYRKKDNHFIIAADAGYEHLRRQGTLPDLLIGDFDTLKGEFPGCETLKYPPEKDYTDTELAVIEGIKRGFRKFIIFGAVGGSRLEHTIANIKLCEYYTKKGYDILLTDGITNVKAINNGKMTFNEEESGFISVFALDGNAECVNIKGLKYELIETDITSKTPTLCVSNEFTGNKAEISVKNGCLTVIWKGNTYYEA